MLFCRKEDCIHRSKRKSSYKNMLGEPMYKCTNKFTIIDVYADGNSDIYKVPNCSCMCLSYIKKGDEEDE